MRVTGSLERDKMTDYIQINDQRIAYDTAGSPTNPPVIFVHGLMSHRGVWAQTVEALKEDFFCIRFDLSGFGESDKPKNGAFTIPEQAQLILEVADHFGIDKFIIAGHSMGGQISAYLAAVLAPQRVTRLIFVDGVVTGKLAEHPQNITRRMVAIGQNIPASFLLMRALSKWKPFACWAFQPWFYKIKEMPFDAWETDRYFATEPGIAQPTHKAWKSVNATDLTPVLKNIMAPALIIFGRQDGTVPVEQALLFKEKLPAARLLLINPCGHFPMYEAFEPYITGLKEFLKQVD